MLPDPRTQGIDPEVQRYGRKLIAALERAQDTADPTPILRLLWQARVVGRTFSSPAAFLALMLVTMTTEAGKVPGTTEDPYRHLRAFVIEHGLCTEQDLKTAFFGFVFHTGLTQGWLPASLYDQLKVMGGDYAQFTELMDQIKRRE